MTFAEAEAKKNEWVRLGVSTTAKVRRMRDVQFISELMMQVLTSGTVVGFDQDEIEQYYADYENPLEFDANFSEEDFIQKFESIKEIILQIETLNNSVTTYAKSSTHLYTLWSVLSDSEMNLPSIDTIASKYREFMQRVWEISQSDSPQKLLSGSDSALYVPAFQYSENAKGANTEEPQRGVRNTTLKEYLLD